MHHILSHMKWMQVNLSADVKGAAIEALAKLSNLQACSFSVNNASAEALNAMSSLTQLSCAEVRVLSLSFVKSSLHLC